MLSLSLSLTLCPRRSTWNKIEMNCLAWRCRLKVNIAKVFPFSLPRPFVSLTICVFVFVYFRRFWYFTCEFTTSVSHHMRRKAFSYFKKSSPLRLWTIFKRSLSLSLSLALCKFVLSLHNWQKLQQPEAWANVGPWVLKMKQITLGKRSQLKQIELEEIIFKWKLVKKVSKVSSYHDSIDCLMCPILTVTARGRWFSTCSVKWNKFTERFVLHPCLTKTLNTKRLLWKGVNFCKICLSLADIASRRDTLCHFGEVIWKNDSNGHTYYDLEAIAQ